MRGIRVDGLVLGTLVGLAIIAMIAVAARSGSGKKTWPTGLVLTGIGIVLMSIDSLLPELRGMAGEHLATLLSTDGIVIAFGIVKLVGLGMLLIGVLLLARSSPRDDDQRLIDAHKEIRTSHSIVESMLRSGLDAKLVVRAERDHRLSEPRFIVRLVNGQVEQLFGRPAARLRDRPLQDASPQHLRDWLVDAASCAWQTGLPYQAERRFDNERTEWFEIRAVRHLNGVTISIADTTDRRRVEDALRREAHTDPLTGLANRAKLKQELASTVHRVQQRTSVGYTLMYLDFDRFKIINDSLGHEVGDELLCSIADRMRAALRALDSASGCTGLASRLGGDEFVLLIEGLVDVERVHALSDELVNLFGEPHQLSGNSVVSTASIGVVIDNGIYSDAQDALRDADTAMYTAKEAGKSCYKRFDDDIRLQVTNELSLEKDLRLAVEGNEFLLAYQPIVDLSTGEITSFEALIRWQHDSRGVVQPGSFIELAEELGLIGQIGEWVLREACKAAISLNEVSQDGKRVRVAVNHSKRELLSGDFVAVVRNVIEETGAEPWMIKVEVTESLCVKHMDEVVPVLRDLRAYGVQAVIDDFGTGDSSITAIERFPIDVLKIDRCFIRSERDDRTRAAILHAMIELAHNLQIPVVAEGVESVEDLLMLQSLDADEGQGWLFSEAIRLEEAERLVANGMSRWIESLPIIEHMHRFDKGLPRAG